MVNGHLLTNITGERIWRLPPADNTAYQREKFCLAMDALLFPGKFSNVLFFTYSKVVLILRQTFSVFVRRNTSIIALPKSPLRAEWMDSLLVKHSHLLFVVLKLLLCFLFTNHTFRKIAVTKEILQNTNHSNKFITYIQLLILQKYLLLKFMFDYWGISYLGGDCASQIR